MTARGAGAAAAVVVLNDTRGERHHGCTRVMDALETLLAASGCRIAASAPSSRDWRADPQVAGALGSARMLVVNGEGTLHDDAPAGMALLAAAVEAERRGIPAVLVNAVWQDNGPEAVALLRRFALVAVRDGRSAAALRAAGVACRVVPDLSLYLPYARRAPRRAGVGFTDSVVRAEACRLERLRRRCGGQVVALQHARPGARGALAFLRGYLAASDLRRPGFLATMLAARLAQRRAQVADPRQLLERLEGLELLVTGRFHACTLALLAGTPFVAVRSNTHKIEALVEDVGLAAWRLADRPTPELVAEARAAGWTREEAAAIGAHLAAARERADALARDLGALL